MAEAPPPGDDGSFYARVWLFVQRQLHLRPRAASCPDEYASHSASPARRRRPRCLSEDGRGFTAAEGSRWGRVAVLKQLEAVQTARPDERALRRGFYYVAAAGGERARLQGTCRNCGARFFRALAGAQAVFCGRDCQSSFDYRRLVQDAVDAQDAWGPPDATADATADASADACGVAIARRPAAF